MKISEKYKVNGNVNNQQVSGEVTIYPNNFTNVPKKSIIAGFRTSLKELKRKFGTISLYDKEKTDHNGADWLCFFPVHARSNCTFLSGCFPISGRRCVLCEKNYAGAEESLSALLSVCSVFAP